MKSNEMSSKNKSEYIEPRSRSSSFNDARDFVEKDSSVNPLYANSRFRNDPPNLHEKNVYIRGLPHEFTDENLYSLASE
ncbi:hypothetical protein AYI68_g2366 [Smittium mucronatum]|uniref:RRM domain-containing protein n=1 Tax=Smittium mucronatum TaxID=133383 RepID=A0A1R0H2V2_9FUNG|nr:hypothetical protein AYI68_g2366 [Smittium mucronatum]